jgi:hypothetical protein
MIFSRPQLSPRAAPQEFMVSFESLIYAGYAVRKAGAVILL